MATSFETRCALLRMRIWQWWRRHSSRTLFISFAPVGLRSQRVKSLPLDQLRQRPHRRAAHQRACIVEQALGLCRQRRIAGVADRDQHIADEAVAADALDRRFRKQRAKRGIVEPCEIGKSRRAQFVARGEFRLAAFLRELVPRTHGEAIVAAIDAVADALAEFVRDRPLVLDGEIGNAAPRIELVGRGKCRGRADIEAGVAGAAMIARRPRRAAVRTR